MPTPSERQEQLLEDVLVRAAQDASFRSRLLVHPHTAIREAFGVRVPESYRMKFLSRDASLDLLIVLPDPMNTTGALDDGDLDAVAGGTDPAAAFTW